MSSTRSNHDGQYPKRRWARRAPLLALLPPIFALCLPLSAQPGSTKVTQKIAAKTVALPESPVTPVTGRSWLRHLGAFVNETSMGRTGQWGPAPPEENDLAVARSMKPQGGFMPSVLAAGKIPMTGADLYRLECQGCHRTDGRGVPPEINSMINPVRATSPDLIRKHMQEIGAPMDAKSARELASQSQTVLTQRISHGGLHMPGFLDLNRAEVDAIVAYVDQLAGVPRAEKRQIQLDEPTLRIGEHLVKATCHICHDATGPKPSPQEMMDGEVPPLSTLTRSKSLDQFVEKVTEGAPVTMGVLQQRYRGRMPVFFYIRPEEAAAAYWYLSMYPPESAAPSGEAAAVSVPAKPKPAAGGRNGHN